MRPRPIVVGTAGDTSDTAVAWAAAEAGRRRQPLRIVHVLEWNAGEARESAGSTYVERVWSAAAAMVGVAASRAREIAPALDLRTDILIGHPADRLLALSHDADLVVVGFRGRGGFAGLRLGSVSRRMGTHAACPVTVVRGRAHPDGPIVAGVDGTPAADRVLEAAFSAAAARGRRLVAIRQLAAKVADGAERLDEQLGPWRHKFPEVPVEIRAGHGSVAAVLTDASRGAGLVVVGSRGRGAIRGALLGSTGLHLLQHAECPVLVVRES